MNRAPDVDYVLHANRVNETTEEQIAVCIWDTPQVNNIPIKGAALVHEMTYLNMVWGLCTRTQIKNFTKVVV